jgi:YfiH family protein
LNNRINIFDSIELPLSYCVFAKQIHDNHIVNISSSHRGCGAFSDDNAINNCDGFITNKKNIALCIQTADCLPIFILDKKNGIISNLHAGWRSTVKKIIIKGINLLIELYNSNPKDIIISFGPCIRECCYEVSADFKNTFNKESIHNKKGRYYLNLIKENIEQAKTLGVHNILSDSALCTSCNIDLFYSHRKEGLKSGRTMSLFALI